MGQFVTQVRVRGQDIDWTAQSGDLETQNLSLTAGPHPPQFVQHGTYQITVPGENERAWMFMGMDGNIANFALYGG
ncbi:hypothetical protein AWB74_07970 [Caballeronia arvi]|uniref:Uncharacterized protein n=1 Tax=Caballeronia arvi TaxID=1777135 RepID=A0A158L1I3_9BURK|nr:hypothetical protein [Caballeronia arvi]SAL87095.1 hypothetical protein AWB74_07970 [Caballeronia arvi]